MFTGIITDIGTFKERKDSSYIFEVSSHFIKKLSNGTSVAINGACMTITNISGVSTFTVDVMPESEKRTMFGLMLPGDTVNLELPATSETFLSGHIVQGHVDGVGKIISIQDAGVSKIVTLTIPSLLTKHIVEKGSIAINGVSLTVIRIEDMTLRVGVIPFTWEHTMLHTIDIGTKVNIETDVFAKYVEKLINKQKK